LAFQPTAILIGIGARFHPHKDHRNFIQAAGLLHKQLPQVVFCFSECELPGRTLQLTEWIDTAGIRECCYLLGMRHDVARLFSGIDIATTASRSEAFPIVVGEAMACGTPALLLTWEIPL